MLDAASGVSPRDVATGFEALGGSLREHAEGANVASASHEVRVISVAIDANDGRGPTVSESLHARGVRARCSRHGQLEAAPGVPNAPLAPNARSETQNCAEVWSTCEKLVPRSSYDFPEPLPAIENEP